MICMGIDHAFSLLANTKHILHSSEPLQRDVQCWIHRNHKEMMTWCSVYSTFAIVKCSSLRANSPPDASTLTNIVNIWIGVGWLIIFTYISFLRNESHISTQGASWLKPWRWKLNVSPKHWHLPVSLHNAKTQKNIKLKFSVKVDFALLTVRNEIYFSSFHNFAVCYLCFPLIFILP